MSLKVTVLGTAMSQGTRRYRLTLADGSTWTGKVRWIDAATDTEPLDIVMGGEQDSTLVLTQTPDAWLLTKGRADPAPLTVTAVEPIIRPRRKRSGTETLQDLLRLK